MQRPARINARAFALAALLMAGFAGPGASQSHPEADSLTLDFLRSAVVEFERRLDKPDIAGAKNIEETGGSEPKGAVEYRTPRGASSHDPGAPADTIETDAPAPARSAPKARAGTSEIPSQDPSNWIQLSFAGSSYTPDRGIGETLLRVFEEPRGDETFAFLLMERSPDQRARDELQKLGIDILGRHDDALKVRVPLRREILDAVMSISGVHSLAYPRPEQKLAPELDRALAEFGNDVDRFPIIVNLFDADREGVFASRIEELGIEVGAYDADLQAYLALASVEEIRRLSEQDFVLFIEIERPSRGGHDQSTPTNSVDYIRASGFSGSTVVLGILDTGFMVGSAAATMHSDLNKNGCGINFTSDAAGVWNDQHGHGTHVLGTVAGTGTGQERYRGVAPGIGDRSRIRAAKIWDSTNSGMGVWLRDALDYMDDASSCDAPRPEIVNLSGGAQGTGMTGTDASARKLDSKVWEFRQAYVVCGGNSGPTAQSIWSPGVAKNALAVGNVRDNTSNQVGELAANSSLGPSGDARMKPNLVATGAEVTSSSAGTTDGYRSMSGCSMATPHVSGIAASLLEHYADFRDRPHLLRAHLMASTVLHREEISPANNSLGGRNDYGLGRISDYQAHWARNNPNGWTTHWAWWDGITDRRWGFWDLEVPRGTDRLVVVMSWDEPAASAGASQAVTYDLDLWADLAADCSPDGHGQCGEWASQSYDDNTEYLIIESPPPGVYRLKVINWDAPSSFGLPAAIAARIIRGDPTPATSLTAFATPANPAVGSEFKLTARVQNPSYEAYGVHVEIAGFPSGVTLLDAATTRQDAVSMTFSNARGLTLGSIVEGDSRSATWRLRMDSPGPKTFRVRSWSDNGGSNVQSVSVTP